MGRPGETDRPNTSNVPAGIGLLSPQLMLLPAAINTAGQGIAAVKRGLTGSQNPATPPGWEKQVRHDPSQLAAELQQGQVAAYAKQAAAGGAWNDPTWPARLHSMLTRRDTPPEWASGAVPVRSRPERYTEEERRTAWFWYWFGTPPPGG